MTVEAFSGELDVEEFKGVLDVEEFTGKLDEEPSFLEGVKGRVGQVLDVVKQAGIGALKGAEQIGETIKDILPETDPSQSLKQPILPDLAKQVEQRNVPESLIGEFSKGAGQFLVGFIPAFKALSSLGMANNIRKGMAAGVIADFSVFDPHEARLANAIENAPALIKPVVEFLQADKDDSKIEGRIKSVLEGILVGGTIGVTFETFMRGLRMVKAGRIAEEAQPPSVIDVADVNQTKQFGETSAGAAQVLAPETIGDSVARSKEVLKNFARYAVDMTGGKSISFLDNLAERSPTMKMLRNSIEAKEFSKEPIGADFTQRVSRNIGEFVTQVNDAARGVQTKFRGKVPKQVDAKITAGLRGETVTGAAKTAVASLRTTLDQMFSYIRTLDPTISVNDAIKVKDPIIDLGYISDWFPRNYISEKLTRAQVKAGKFSLKTDEGAAAFSKVLGRYGIEVTEADDIVEKIVNNEGILDGSKSEFSFAPKGLETRKVTNELSRKLIDIPDSELAPFLHDDAIGTIKTYIQQMVKRVEVARIAGQGGGKLQNKIEAITEEARQSGKRLTIGERNRIINILNALQQTYRPLLPHLRNAYKLNNTYQFMRTLSLATLSSLTEPFVVLLRGRTSAAVKAILPTMSHVLRESARQIFKNIPQAEATRFTEKIGLALDQDVSERMAAVFGGEVTKIGNAFFRAIGLHQWTRVGRVYGAVASRIAIKENLRDLIKFENKTGVALPLAKDKKHFGKLLPNKRFDELVELGIEPREGIRWLKAGAKSDDPFVRTMEFSIIRFVNEVVMNPRVAILPMLASRPSLQPVFQLKKFQITFGNTVVKRIFHQMLKRGTKEGTVNAAKAAAVVSMMVFTAMMVNRFREQIRFGDEGNPRHKGETPEEEMVRALDRTGLTGELQIFLDSLFAHRFGQPGLIQISGPTFTQLQALETAAMMAIDPKSKQKDRFKGLKREAVKAIPFINISKRSRKATEKILFGE